MHLQLHLVPLAGFVGLMATAAFEDIRRLVIPNTIIIGLGLLWPFHLAAAVSVTLAASVGAAGCAVAVFFAGALLFSRGLVGGGDVKLMAAATLWAGPIATPALLIITALLGGFLTLFLLSPAGVLLTARQPVSTTAVAGTNRVNPVSVPYGVAIAAAALIVTIPPSFSG